MFDKYTGVYLVGKEVENIENPGGQTMPFQPYHSIHQIGHISEGRGAIHQSRPFKGPKSLFHCTLGCKQRPYWPYFTKKPQSRSGTRFARETIGFITKPYDHFHAFAQRDNSWKRETFNDLQSNQIENADSPKVSI